MSFTPYYIVSTSSQLVRADTEEVTVSSQYRPPRYRRSPASSRVPGLAFLIICPLLVRGLGRLY
jgi:hypothetical protein